MKKVYIVRHAKSSWDNPLLNDSERTLNKRGKRDAPFMAKLLKKIENNPDLIISSPAVRAFSTAKIFAEVINYSRNKIRLETSIYEADINDLLLIISRLDDKIANVIVVGHNPSVTDFVNYVTGQNITNMPTCSICAIEFNFNSWKNILYEKGNLRFFEYPKKYAC